MRLHPTRATFHAALAGGLLISIGIAARLAPVVAFGGAMVLAVAIGRALALVSVTRLRAAGFEMVWTSTRRVVRTSRGEALTIVAELRNRGLDDMRGVGLRAIASSLLEVRTVPEVVDLPARTRVRVNVLVRARRVGRWGLHGMALEVRGVPAGGEGLYEVPLMFANPFGIEVYPRSSQVAALSARGGRSRRSAEAGRPAPLSGDGEELRELRDHVPGDPFRRIAWKASARRRKLIVREMQREERDVLWLILDASVDLWAGVEGHAPLDEAVEELASLATRHLARGDRVGLAVYASRIRTYLTPAGGLGQGQKIAAALTSAASTIDADRCELDEWDVAQRVIEHARPLDPRGLEDIPRSNLDMLAARAQQLRSRAPFAPRIPFASTAREQALRHYLAAFGIEVPPRASGERMAAQETLGAVLDRILKEKERPSLIHVFANVPGPDADAWRLLRRLKSRRVTPTWTVPALERSVAQPLPPRTTGTSVRVADIVNDAVRARAALARVRAERSLRKQGVRPRMQHLEPRAATAPESSS